MEAKEVGETGMEGCGRNRPGWIELGWVGLGAGAVSGHTGSRGRVANFTLSE